MSLCLTASFLFLFISLAGSLQIITEKPPPLAFSFDFSSKEATVERLLLHGGAKLDHSSVSPSAPGASVIYSKPLGLSGGSTDSGFTTRFSFSAVPENVVSFGELDFVLLPGNSENGDSLFETNGGVLQLELPPNAVSVKLVSVNKTESFIKISVGADLVAESSGLLSAGLSGPLHCMIKYNGMSKRMEVKIRESKDSEMMSTMLSYPVDLTSLLLKERLFVGMRYSGRDSTQGITLNSWSFSADQGYPVHAMHSEPLDPRSFAVASTKDHQPADHKRRGHTWGILVAVVFAVACAVVLVWYTIVSTLNSVSNESENGGYPTQSGYRKMLMLEGEHAKGCLELEDFN